MFSLLTDLFPRDEITSSLSIPVAQLAKKRKRSRYSSSAISSTNASVRDRSDTAELVEERPRKKVCFKVSAFEHVVEITPPASVKPPSLTEEVPEEVLCHILSFCGGMEDRSSVSATCQTFSRITKTHKPILQHLRVGGDATSDRGCILNDHDTPETAERKLTPFCQANNMEAIYMLGMTKAYCHTNNVEEGVELLQQASRAGYTRATYTLGLILRDVAPLEAKQYMKEASAQGYLPALQETLPARVLKQQYGEPPSSQLCQYLDPNGLNRLLARHYVTCRSLRNENTSHCWNPLCGKWAFRADRKTQHQHCSLNHTISSRVSRMKMCSRCCRAKYCSKLCQVYDWRSGRHKVECPFL